MKKLLVIAVGCALASGAFASKGFQASLVPDVAVHDRDTEINGVSIGVWNENPSPKFQWQLGFVNGSTGDSVGVKWFIFLPTIYNYAESFTGLSWGIVNYASEDFTGVQLGAVNIVSGKMTGLQASTVNYCGDLTGLQFGLVNWAKHSTSGVQLGLVNIIPENQWFADGDFGQGMIFFNWGF